MVGKNTVVVFTASSENSDSLQTFDLETRTAVGAAYEVSLFFEDESGISLTQLNEDGVAGEWNEYQLKIANEGQATNSIFEGVDDDTNIIDSDEDEDLLEIPAFLRRQAN